MGDMGDDFRALNKHKQEKRASNRQSGADRLAEAGYTFVSNNGGAHLIISHGIGKVDYWPGTGLFQTRGYGFDAKGRGIKSLLATLKTLSPK